MDGFANVLAECRHVMVSVAKRILGSLDEAEDAVQEAAIRVWESRESVKLDTFRPILLRATVNAAITATRRPSRKRVDFVNDFADDMPAEDSGFAEFEADATIDGIFDLAPRTPQIEAVRLVDAQDLTYQEAAAAMNCPIGTIRSRVFDGRRLMRPILRKALSAA